MNMYKDILGHTQKKIVNGYLENKKKVACILIENFCSAVLGARHPL